MEYRQARLDDAAEILALLLRLAPEMPLLVDSLEREEALYGLIRECARSGESWVAAEAGAQIVGFAIVEPNRRSRHYAEHEILELRFAGVAPEQRGRGIFGELVARVLGRMVPVTATVAAQNRSAAAARLQRLGFRLQEGAGGERRLRWDPGQPSSILDK